MAELLDIAVSGLVAHQVALNVTGQNIANSSTEGYSRQRAEFQARSPDFAGGFFIGRGTDIETVNRITSEFTQARLRNDLSAAESAATLSGLLDQLDLLFSSPDTGLTGGLERLYAAFQTASDNPTSVEARQILLSEAEALQGNFALLNDQLDGVQRNVATQIRTATTSVNELAQEVAALNQQIQLSSSGGAAPNDLLDRRDTAIRELAKLTDLAVVPQDDGSLNVFIGSGQGLVVGNQAFSLEARADSSDPQQLNLFITVPGGAASSGVSISSGIVGALLNAQGNVINDAYNNVGLTALGIAEGLNQIHQLGIDLENNIGGNFFTDINNASAISARSIAATGNSLPADQVIDVSISDISAITTSDYQLTFTSATTYVLSRRSDGLSNTALDPGLTGTIAGLPATLSVDGLSISLDRPSGNFATGDSYRIRPTRDFPALLELEVPLGEQIALGLPIRTDTNINNTGSGVISQGSVTDTSTAIFTTTPGQLAPPILIQFTSPSSYDLINADTLAAIAVGLSFPPAAPAGIIPGGVGLDGFQVEIDGSPAAGDEFNVVYNANGIQDNRNGLALAGLQLSSFLYNGTSTVDEAYALFVQEVGTATRSARVDLEASEILVAQSEQRLQQVAGVNLDEEAARLIEYEQAYSAAAQMISVSRSIFDTLLNSSRPR